MKPAALPSTPSTPRPVQQPALREHRIRTRERGTQPSRARGVVRSCAPLRGGAALPAAHGFHSDVTATKWHATATVRHTHRGRAHQRRRDRRGGHKRHCVRAAEVAEVPQRAAQPVRNNQSAAQPSCTTAAQRRGLTATRRPRARAFLQVFGGPFGGRRPAV
jgi:hypothetical protein